MDCKRLGREACTASRLAETIPKARCQHESGRPFLLIKDTEFLIGMNLDVNLVGRQALTAWMVDCYPPVIIVFARFQHGNRASSIAPPSAGKAKPRASGAAARGSDRHLGVPWCTGVGRQGTGRACFRGAVAGPMGPADGLDAW